MSEHHFVPHLPDLIHPEDYADDPEGKRVRVRIEITEEGVQILGDAMRPLALEQLLQRLGARVIERMLCG